MDKTTKINLADAFTDSRHCCMMFEQLVRKLHCVDSTVALLALEGLNRIGYYPFEKPHRLKTEQFKLGCDLIEKIKNVVRHWRCESPLRDSFDKKCVPELLKCLTIFKSLNIPLYVGNKGHKRTLNEFDNETEDIYIDGNTRVYIHGEIGGSSYRPVISSVSGKHSNENVMAGRLYKIFSLNHSQSSKTSDDIHDQLNDIDKRFGCVPPFVINPDLSIRNIHDDQNSSVFPVLSFNDSKDNNIDNGDDDNAHVVDNNYTRYDGCLDTAMTTTLHHLGVNGLRQGEIIYVENYDNNTNVMATDNNNSIMYVILYAVNAGRGGESFEGLKKPSDTLLKRLYNDDCVVEIVIFVPDKEGYNGDSSLWFPSFQSKTHEFDDNFDTENIHRNDKENTTSQTNPKNDIQFSHHLELNVGPAMNALTDPVIESEMNEETSHLDSGRKNSGGGGGDIISNNSYNCCDESICCSSRRDVFQLPRKTTGHGQINSNNETTGRCRDRYKDTMDVVGAFTSSEGCILFFALLTDELTEVDETIGLLALEGLFRLSRDIEELRDPEIKPLPRDVIGQGYLVKGIRRLLQKWVCNFPTGTEPKIWWKLRYCLFIYRTLQVPMFLDYLFRVTVKGLTTYKDDQMEEVEIDGDTSIYHVTHHPEAKSIVDQNKFKASDRKNTVKGTWFSPGVKKVSIYGSKCFKTKLSLLGVTGLYQGEIIYYKDERNVILYATDEPGATFKGLKKPTESFVKEEAKTLPYNKDRNPRPFVHISIFVPSRFLPSPNNFRYVVSQENDVLHKPFCIRVCRRYRESCNELACYLPPPSHFSQSLLGFHRPHYPPYNSPPLPSFQTTPSYHPFLQNARLQPAPSQDRLRPFLSQPYGHLNRHPTRPQQYPQPPHRFLHLPPPPLFQLHNPPPPLPIECLQYPGNLVYGPTVQGHQQVMKIIPLNTGTLVLMGVCTDGVSSSTPTNQSSLFPQSKSI